MSLNVTLNGSMYIIPETGEVGWGGNTTSYLVAIAAGVLQKTGGSFTLSAELDFGASFGIKSLYYKSRSTNIAASGILRLNNNADAVSWRNAANTTDLPLTVDASDRLSYNGTPVLTGTTPSAYVSSITGTANQVIASAATGPVTLSLPQSIATTSNVQFGTLGLGSSTVASSILSLTSTTLGFLPPRLTTAERDLIASPATGLFIYNTSTGVNNYYNGTVWVAIAAGGTINAGLQYQFGYYAANGTTISGLTTITTDVNGRLLLPAGTQALPAVSFTGDPNTGIFTIGADQVSVVGGANLIMNFGITQSNLYISSASRFQWEATSYLPNVDNTIDLGTTAMNWRSLYLSTSIKNGATTLATATELGYLTGVTSAIQTQINTKAPSSNPTFTGVVLIADGSAATPSLAFSADTNTGIYRVGTDQLTISTGGTLTANFGNTQSNIYIGGSSLFQFDGTNFSSARQVLITPTTNQLVLGTTNVYTINATAPAASRVITLADPGAAASFVLTEGAQTINGQKTFGAAVLHADGTVSLPGISFSADTDTGMYRIGANNTGIAANGANVASFASTGVSIKGTTTNDNAATGFVGEFVSSGAVTNTNAAATTVQDDITSISLTAGDWDLEGGLRWENNGATWTQVLIAISTTAGNDNTGQNNAENQFTESWASSSTTPVDKAMMVPRWRLSLSATTTVYLKRSANYSAGTPRTRAYFLGARRVR